MTLKASILIVEDEQIVAMDIQNTLENNGFMVAGQADQGEDAVEKAGELHPDLVLMDIGLKGEMDGIEAAIQIRAQFDLPVIFLTAYSNPTIIDRARLAEPFAYIIKPFEERELVSNIEMALYKHGMEKKLRESENKFRSVVKHASDGIALVDSQGNIIEWNPKMEQITGLNRSETLGQPIWEVTFQMLPREEKTSATRDAHALMWKASITGAYSNNDQNTERVIETPQGAHRIVQSSGFVIATIQGPLAGVIMRDITERKQAEAALKENEIIFSSFLEQSQVYVFFKDKYIRSLRLSKNYEQMLGMPLSSLLGKTMDDLFQSDLAKSMVADDLRILNEGRHVNVVEEFNGRIYETDKFPIFKDGKPDMLAGITLDITDRKRAEEELRESEARYRRLVEGTPDVVYTFSSKRGGVYYSPRVEQVLGYSMEHLYSHPFLWNESIHPDDRDRISETIREFELGKSFDIEYRIQDVHGNWRWLQDRSIGRHLGIDEVLIEGVATDITERKLSEEALRESEERLRLSLQAANQGLYDLNIQTGAAIVNREYAQMLGYDPESFVETNTAWIERLHPDDRGITTKAYTDYINGLTPEYRVEFRQKMRDGNWKWIFSLGKVVEYSAEGKPQRMLGTHTDITERKQAEAELRKLSQAVEQSANAIVITDIAGKIEYANPKFSEVSGYSLPEALGQNPRILRSGEHDPEFYKNLWNTIKSGRVWRGKLHNRRKDGRLYWEDTTITPVYDAAHNLVNFIAIKEDITARKILEEAERDQRQLAEALRDTSAALTSTLNLDDVLDRVLDNIGKLVTYDAAMVLLIEGHSVRKIRHRNHVAYGASDQPRLGNTQANLINVPILQAIRETREPCLIPDTQADERWRAVPGMGWVRSFISAPVEIRGRVAGLINILSEKPGFFTSFHSERLMAFASQAAVAIENAQLFEQAYHLSITDPLTELSNRRYFFDVAKFEFERTHRYKRTLSIMMVDIDHFKNINDIHGHAVGDLALREIATRIKNSVRAVDIVARYGGEEFIILMPETELNEACQVAERVRRSVADNPIEEDNATINATLSIGVAEIDELSKNMDQLIIYADQALYAAKAAGRNRVTSYEKAGNIHVEAES